MKINKESIPTTMEAPGTKMRAQADFGGMTVCFNELPKGTDFTPLLKGLNNDSCHCPHWGYTLEVLCWSSMMMAKKNYSKKGMFFICHQDIRL